MLKDTLPAIEEIYLKKLKEKTDIDRAFMGFSMFETARSLVMASLPTEKMNKNDIKIAVFNRFYGNDFDHKTKEKIIKHLKAN